MKNWLKRKSTRRILSFVLSIALMLTLLPMPSIAAEGDVEPDAPVDSRPEEKTEKVITDWAWVDPDEWLDETGSFAMPGVTEDYPAYFEDVVEYLPTQVTAVIDGVEVPLDLGDWSCEAYPMETGTSQGEFVFTTTLPEGYVLADGSNTFCLPVTVEPVDLSDGEEVSGYASGGNGVNEDWDGKPAGADSVLVRNWNSETSQFEYGKQDWMYYRKLTQKYDYETVEWTKWEYLRQTNDNPTGVLVYPEYCVGSETAEITGTLIIKDDINLILCAQQTNGNELPDMVLTVGNIQIPAGKTLTIWTRSAGRQGGKLIVKGNISGDGTLVVRDGYVEAQNITCKFSTGGSANGKQSLGVVKANSITDQSDKANWGGVIVENGVGLACGTAEQELIYDLQCDKLTIDSGKTLTVGWDGVNNIGARHNVKLIAYELVNNGTLNNKAKLYYNTRSGSGTTAERNGGYGYYKNENGEKVYRPFTIVTSDITELKNTATTNDGWYLVSGNVEWTDRVAVVAESTKNTVNLVLADGCTLTAKNGITVAGAGTPTLIIWCQEAGTGTLTAQTSVEESAAIGRGESDYTNGVITIHGGNINAEYTGSGWKNAEDGGLGGCSRSAAFTVTINGGTINTPAIVSRNLTINGGTITVSDRISGRFLAPATDGGSTFVTTRQNWASSTGNRRGLFFIGDTGEVCTGTGTELTLARAMEVPAGKTLVIPAGKTLNAGNYLTNSGAVCVGGAYTGSLSGDVYYRLSVTGGTAASAGNTKTIDGVTYVKAGSTVTLTPGTAPAGKRFDHWNPPAGLTINGNTFTMLDKTVDISAAYSDAVQITAEPADQEITYGENVTLSVTAVNPDSTTEGITYQWYQVTDGRDVALTDETSATLSFYRPGAGTCSYFCRVTWEGICVDSRKVTVKVNQAAGSVIINNDPGKSYDGTPAVTGYTVTGMGNVTIEYKVRGADDSTYTKTAPTDAGSYTVRVTLPASTNYTGASDTKDFTISQAVDNEWKTLPAVTDFTYGDTVADPVTYQAKYGNDSVLVTYKKQGTEDTPSTTVPTEAGTYDVEVSLAETANYPALAPVQLTLTIRPKSLSDSDINVTLVGDTPVYDGTGKTRTVTVKFGETTLEEGTDYTLSGNTATTAGTHTLTVTGQGNYSGSTTKDWTITRASITPTVTIADTVYGETLNPGVNGNTENGAVTYTYYSDAACETVVTPKNVGTYYVRATIAETNNYQQATTAAQSFRITQKSVTVTITPNGGTYGDVTPAGATLGGVVAGDTVPVTLTYTGNANDGTNYDSTTAPTKAGTYTVTAAISDGNYTLTGETTAQFVIEKATVTTPTPDSKTYTGETQTADIADTDRYTVTKNDGGIHADSYDVVLTLRDSHNYKWDDANGKTTFRITKATDNTWTIIPAINGWTYGDTPDIPKGEAGFGTVTVEYTADGTTYSTTVPTGAGTYKARFTVADTGDFNGLSAEKAFTISPKTITVSITPNGGIYGATITPATATLKGVVADDTVPVTLTYTGTANDGTVCDSTTAPTKAGTYTVTATVSDGNYTLTGETTAQFVIQKATVPTPTVLSKVYNGKLQTADISDTDLYTVTGNDGGKAAGSYKVALSLRDSHNCEWDANGGTTTFRITKATDNTWTIIPAINGWTYGDTPDISKGEARFGTVTVEYTADGTAYSTTVPTKAGTYKARFTVADTGDYNGLSAEETFTIGAKSVTVTITPNGGIYGHVTPAGATLKGVVAGDNVPVTLTYTGTANDGTSYDSTTAPTKAGTYTVTATISDGNYTLTGETTAQFVIEKVTVPTPTVLGKVYNGKLQTADIADTDLYTVTKNDGGIHADSCDVVLTLRDSNNYEWDNANGKTTFRITKADNTWTIVPAINGWTYGDTPAAPKGEARFGTVTVEYTADGTAYSTTVPTKAGTYKARFTVADTGDYNGLSAEETFTIGKAPLTVSANDHTITYGDAPANNGVTYTGFVNGEDASVLVGTPVYTYSYSRYGNAGSYTITLEGLNSDNYDITFENGTLTVDRKEIGIAWGGTSLYYNGAAQAPTATVTGLINDDACGITVTGQQTDAGYYTATATALSNNNYKLPENNTCTFFIAKVAPDFTAPTGRTVVYTGGELALAEGAKTAHGTMQYRLGEDNEWSTAIPNGIGIGTYTIYYQVVGDKNHTNTEPGSVTAQILPFVVEKVPQDTTINYGKDTRLSFELTTALKGEVTYQWYQFNDRKGGYVELPGETGNTLTLTGPDAGKYTYVCIASYGEYRETSREITVTVAPGEISLGKDVDLSGFWLEGGEAPASAGQTKIFERSAGSRLLIQYTSSDNDQGDTYPSGMKVYKLDENNRPVEIEELRNLLQYSGCSIRFSGKRGICMITSLTKEAKTALTESNLAGYTLEEYGTVVQWKDNLRGAGLTLDNGNHNYAYKKGVSDPVFANLNDLTQYTNVLVWERLTNEQLGKDIVMRPYIILKDANGETVTLYGGSVSRSIGYIACQNRNVFEPGTAAYKYVWDIIHAVYGTRYDSDYKG